MAQYVIDLLTSLTSSCFPAAEIRINSRRVKELRLLGEGGFAFVYLVEEVGGSGAQYALKKIRCPFGTEDAHRERDAYKMFNHPNIMKCVDSATVQERDGGKTVLILLPYYRRGNLQDLINFNVVNRTTSSDRDVLKLFRGVCKALEVIHGGRQTPKVVPPRMEDDEDDDAQESTAMMRGSKNAGSDRGAVAYAHRDIKPGNIMIGDDGVTPILMDFGSMRRARQEVRSRAEAIEVQDDAEVHCSMHFRAPELFDVRTGATLTEAVDIWSLGCTLYATLYGRSPFDTGEGSPALAVLNGQYKIPEDGDYSEGTKDVIRKCLQVDPNDRPTAIQVLEMVDKALAQL
ncbi:Serine/threonine-protein kinase env7 [Saitoella coloradoensis]